MKIFATAQLKTTVHRQATPHFIKKLSGHKIKDWVFHKGWNLFVKWGNVKQHYEEASIDTFVFTENVKQSITDMILSEIDRQYEYYHHVDPTTHVGVIGEATFFEIVDGSARESPFFRHPHTFFSRDIVQNDRYHGRRIYNFPCHVVPAMEGFALIPKALVE